MDNATTYQDLPTTGGAIALQVQPPNAQPVMVSLRMALGMVAFGVSVVALGFVLVIGKASPVVKVKAPVLLAVPNAALSTSVGSNAKAIVVMAVESVAAFATARAAERANASTGLKLPAPVAATRQTMARHTTPLVARSPTTIVAAGAHRKRRDAFYKDIPSWKSTMTP